MFILIIFIPLSNCTNDPTSGNADPNALEYISPESVGYSSSDLDQAKQYGRDAGYAAVMALYGDKVFFSFGQTSYNYWTHSIRKPFLSAIFGIHVGNGNIDLDATLGELGINDTPDTLTYAEKQAKVRDLLTSRSGVYIPAAAEAPSMEETRPERGSHSPGTFYYYNNWDFNVLGSIFEQESGTKIFEEFKVRIADPIGMEDFSIANCHYQYELEKSSHPAYPFRMSARDMARFGALYLNNGNWKGEQIIPADWIAQSTTGHCIMDSTFGVEYGYLWMVTPEGSPAADLFLYPCYFHTGVGIHVLVVVPGENLVIVLRWDTDGEWTDPGDEVQMQFIQMILNAKI